LPVVGEPAGKQGVAADQWKSQAQRDSLEAPQLLQLSPQIITLRQDRLGPTADNLASLSQVDALTNPFEELEPQPLFKLFDSLAHRPQGRKHLCMAGKYRNARW
jgi:hypothetical protein